MDGARQTLHTPAAGLRRAVEAVNAAGPPSAPADPAALADALVGVLRAHGEPGPFAGVEAEAGELAAVLAELHAILAEPDPEASVARLNAALAASTGPLRLVREPGTAWHLHADRPGAGWAAWLAASSLLALAVHVAEHGDPAWGACRSSGCRRVYARSGPGRPRRTCSPACAARLRQAELRLRRRSA